MNSGNIHKKLHFVLQNKLIGHHNLAVISVDRLNVINILSHILPAVVTNSLTSR